MVKRALTVLAAAVLPACAASEPIAPVAGTGSPVVRASGPDAADHGATPAGFARADASTFFDTRYLVDSHSRLDEIFPAHTVVRADRPSPLRRAPSEPAITYRVYALRDDRDQPHDLR